MRFKVSQLFDGAKLLGMVGVIGLIAAVQTAAHDDKPHTIKGESEHIHAPVPPGFGPRGYHRQVTGDPLDQVCRVPRNARRGRRTRRLLGRAQGRVVPGSSDGRPDDRGLLVLAGE